MGIKALLFDLDGTLIDTGELLLGAMDYAVTNVLRTSLPPDVLLQDIGKPLEEMMRAFSDEPETQALLCRLHREYNSRMHDRLAKPFPGARSTVEHLRAEGYAVGVVTSKHRSTALRGIERCGLSGAFECLVCPDVCPICKPNPDPLLKAAQLLDKEPEECLYVGDSPFDVIASKAAGMASVAALWGMFPAERLIEEGPDYLANEIAEVLPLAKLAAHHMSTSTSEA